MRTGSPRVLGIMLFTLIGASALVLGVINTGSSISTPLKADLGATAEFSNAINGGGTNADIAELKSKDTDGDGLSDYDELYFYQTSPYIKDSDSDSIPDGVEVKNGTDPNCPQGQDCGVPAPIITNPPAASGNETPSSLLPELSSGAIPTATVTDAAQIRQLLKDQGMTDDMLSAIDDQTLVQMYNDSAASVQNANTNTNQ